MGLTPRKQICILENQFSERILEIWKTTQRRFTSHRVLWRNMQKSDLKQKLQVLLQGILECVEWLFHFAEQTACQRKLQHENIDDCDRYFVRFNESWKNRRKQRF